MTDPLHDPRCKCEFRIKMVGDGCRYCQPQGYIDRLHDQIEDMQMDIDSYERDLEELEDK